MVDIIGAAHVQAHVLHQGAVQVAQLRAVTHHLVYRVPGHVVWGTESVTDVVEDGPGFAPRAPAVPEIIVQYPEEVPYGRSRPEGELAGGEEPVLPKQGLLLLLYHQTHHLAQKD